MNNKKISDKDNISYYKVVDNKSSSVICYIKYNGIELYLISGCSSRWFRIASWASLEFVKEKLETGQWVPTPEEEVNSFIMLRKFEKIQNDF